MSTGKKTLLVLAGIVAILVVGAFSAFVILVHDEPPPDDSDLVLVRPQISAEQNAWTYYAQASEKLNLPHGDEDEKWPPAPKAATPAPAAKKPSEESPEPGFDEPPPGVGSRWNDIACGMAWEQPLVNEVLARNAEALTLWQKGLAQPECVVPEFKDAMKDTDRLYPPLHLANLVSVRARNLARQGNDEVAMEDAMRLVRFGHQIEGGKGAAVSYLVGITLKQMGLELMRDLARESRLPPERLRRLAAEIASYQVEARALAETLQAEYDYSRSTLHKIASGKMDLDPLPILSATGVRAATWERFFYKPNRTRRLLAEAFRKMIAAAPKHYADMPTPDMLRAAALEEQRIAGGNSFGGMLLYMDVSAVANALRVKCQTSVEVAATRVLLAMKAFKMEKGRLPTTLQELVPDYLDAVPLDDFDGKPFRYNPAKKVIYSVGKDLRDDSGMTKREYVEARMKERGLDPKMADPVDLESDGGEYPWNAPDPSFPIDF